MYRKYLKMLLVQLTNWVKKCKNLKTEILKDKELHKIKSNVGKFIFLKSVLNMFKVPNLTKIDQDWSSVKNNDSMFL